MATSDYNFITTNSTASTWFNGITTATISNSSGVTSISTVANTGTGAFGVVVNGYSSTTSDGTATLTNDTIASILPYQIAYQPIRNTTIPNPAIFDDYSDSSITIGKLTKRVSDLEQELADLKARTLKDGDGKTLEITDRKIKI